MAQSALIILVYHARGRAFALRVVLWFGMGKRCRRRGLCLRRCQEGDPEAKRILIERNLRLVAHVAKKYQGNGEELEDLISIGTIGLIKAISTFNSERSARLSTYAARCIDNELLMMLRARKKCSREVSLYEPIGTDKEGNEISLLDIIESPPVDIVEEYSTRQDIRFLFLL